jgi:hypothetical protein
MGLADSDAAVVALGADNVPGLKTLLADEDLRPVRIPGGLGRNLGEGVELVDVVAGAREHHHVAAVGACLPPVGEHFCGRVVGVGDGVQPARVGVDVDHTAVTVAEAW